MKFFAALLLLTSVLLLTSRAAALDATSSSRTMPKDRIETRKAAVQEKIEATKEMVATKKSAVAEMKADKKELMASRSAEMSKIREEASAKREKAKAEFQAKLKKFRDQKKALLAEKIDTNLNRINENRTAQMSQNLEKMNTLIMKLEDRVAKLPATADPAAVKSAIVDAKASVASASATVAIQSGKDYTVKLTEESKLRIDVQTTRDALFNDLKSTHQSVIDARKSVAKALSELEKLVRI